LELTGRVDLAVSVTFGLASVKLAGEQEICGLEGLAPIGHHVANLLEVAGRRDLDGTAAAGGGCEQFELVHADTDGVEMGDACALMRCEAAGGTTLAAALAQM
jgi:hypothetical protein